MDRDSYQRQNQQRAAKRKEEFEWRKFWKWRPRWWRTPSDKFSFFVALFTAMLAVVAGIQAVLVGNQIQEMRDENRPWIYPKGISPQSSLVIKDDSATLVLQFMLTNTGHVPARFANIDGDFVFASDADPIQKTFGEAPACTKRRSTMMPGTSVFPDESIPINHLFEIVGHEFLEWKSFDPNTRRGAPMIVGCADYLFPSGATHHQTKFIVEVDKVGTETMPFVRIDPAPGEIKKADINLAFNPTIPRDAD
jgi:hypothetical protein